LVDGELRSPSADLEASHGLVAILLERLLAERSRRG